MLASLSPISHWPSCERWTVALNARTNIVRTRSSVMLLNTVNILYVALQLTYPGTRISTLEEVFAFAECADPSLDIQWNIESKINAQFPNQTRGVQDFVQKQHAIFSASSYRNAITVSAVVAFISAMKANITV